MNAIRIILSLIAATAVAPCVVAVSKADLSRSTPVPANEQIPAVDFVRRPLMASPLLNRAGTHVAALMSLADAHVQLLVQDLATQKFEYLIAPDEMDVTSFVWLDDKRILFTVQYNRLFVATIGDFKHAYRVLEYYSQQVVSVPEKNRLRPLVWTTSLSSQDPTGNVVALKADYADSRTVNIGIVGQAAISGQGELGGISLDELNHEHVAFEYPRVPSGFDAGYFADKEGELAFALAYTDGIGKYHVLQDGKWKTSPVDTDERRIVAAGNEPGQAVVIARNPPGTPSALQFMDVATGELGAVLLQDAGYDFNGWLFRDPGSHNVVGAVYERAAPNVIWFSEAYQKLQKTVDAFFPGLVVRVLDGDRAGKKFLLSTWSDRQPTTYYILDVEQNAVGLIKNSVPWLDPKRMSPTSVIQFKTRDGHKLDAYVTVPPATSKTNPAPLVVLVDTGLWGRATIDLNLTAQYFASRGYAVLRPNHRWSAGYAWQFPREDEWAFDKMGQDVSEATKAVLRSGLIDRNRIAAMGFDWGVNIALTSVSDSPDLYRCAVAIRGVYDIGQYIKEAKYFAQVDVTYGLLSRKLGDPRRDKQKLDAMSPARRADQIRIPVYLSHHRESSGVARAQVGIFTSALDANHTPYELHWQSGLWKGTDMLNDSIDLLETTDAFLAKHMPAK